MISGGDSLFSVVKLAESRILKFYRKLLEVWFRLVYFFSSLNSCSLLKNSYTLRAKYFVFSEWQRLHWVDLLVRSLLHRGIVFPRTLRGLVGYVYLTWIMIGSSLLLKLSFKAWTLFFQLLEDCIFDFALKIEVSDHLLIKFLKLPHLRIMSWDSRFKSSPVVVYKLPNLIF